MNPQTVTATPSHIQVFRLRSQDNSGPPNWICHLLSCISSHLLHPIWHGWVTDCICSRHSCAPPGQWFQSAEKVKWWSLIRVEIKSLQMTLNSTNWQERAHRAAADSHPMWILKIYCAITSPASGKNMFLHLCKVKNEKRSSRRRDAFRAEGWDESYLDCLRPRWYSKGIRRRMLTVPCDYAPSGSTLSLHSFTFISIWMTGHTASGALLSSFATATHPSQSLPLFSPSSTRSPPCIHIHLAKNRLRRCMRDVYKYASPWVRTENKTREKAVSWKKHGSLERVYERG